MPLVIHAITRTVQLELPASEATMTFEDKISELKQKVKEFTEQISALERTKKLEDNAELNIQVNFVLKKFDVSGIGYRLERDERYSGFVRLYLKDIPHFIRETYITERGTAADVCRICIASQELKIAVRNKIFSILTPELISDDEDIKQDDLEIVFISAPAMDSLSRKIDVLETETSYLQASACTFEK